MNNIGLCVFFFKFSLLNLFLIIFQSVLFVHIGGSAICFAQGHDSVGKMIQKQFISALTDPMKPNPPAQSEH